MTTDFKEVLDVVQFCIDAASLSRVSDEENALWSSGSSSRPRLTVAVLKDIRQALLIANKLMQEPSQGMLYTFGMEYDPGLKYVSICSSSFYRLKGAFKAMRDQMIKEIKG